jgi:hypothetical protein
MQEVDRMPHRVWRPNIGGISHTVVARWSHWAYEGEVVLDTAVIKIWGNRKAEPDIDFEIEGHHAFLRNSTVGPDLYIDGDRIQYITVTLPHDRLKVTSLSGTAS